MAKHSLTEPELYAPLTDSPRFIFWLYTWIIISPIILAFLDAVFQSHDFWFGPLFHLIEDNFGLWAKHGVHYITYFIPSIVLLCLAPLNVMERIIMFLSWGLIDAVPIIYVYYFTVTAIAGRCETLQALHG